MSWVALSLLRVQLRQGWGCQLFPSVTIEKELQLKSLCKVDLDPQLQRPFSFVRQRQKFRLHAMEELLEYARNYCAPVTPAN